MAQSWRLRIMWMLALSTSSTLGHAMRQDEPGQDIGTPSSAGVKIINWPSDTEAFPRSADAHPKSPEGKQASAGFYDGPLYGKNEPHYHGLAPEGASRRQTSSKGPTPPGPMGKGRSVSFQGATKSQGHRPEQPTQQEQAQPFLPPGFQRLDVANQVDEFMRSIFPNHKGKSTEEKHSDRDNSKMDTSKQPDYKRLRESFFEQERNNKRRKKVKMPAPRGLRFSVVGEPDPDERGQDMSDSPQVVGQTHELSRLGKRRSHSPRRQNDRHGAGLSSRKPQRRQRIRESHRQKNSPFQHSAHRSSKSSRKTDPGTSQHRRELQRLLGRQIKPRQQRTEINVPSGSYFKGSGFHRRFMRNVDPEVHDTLPMDAREGRKGHHRSRENIDHTDNTKKQSQPETLNSHDETLHSSHTSGSGDLQRQRSDSSIAKAYAQLMKFEKQARQNGHGQDDNAEAKDTQKASGEEMPPSSTQHEISINTLKALHKSLLEISQRAIDLHYAFNTDQPTGGQQSRHGRQKPDSQHEADVRHSISPQHEAGHAQQQTGPSSGGKRISETDELFRLSSDEV